MKFRAFLLSFLCTAISAWSLAAYSWKAASAQEPTVTDTPTVILPAGMYITVPTTNTEDHVNVRIGPSLALYPEIIGSLPRGATAAALGRSPGGDWIQIEFANAPGGKGWIYSPLVMVSPGTLPIVEPPPTPVPPPSPTIDSTLAAQFNIVPSPTRLPTFTPPPIWTAPVFTDNKFTPSRLPAPPGTIILLLGFLGSMGLMASFFWRR